ncbi:MAG: DNA cytosine methyltransferase [Pyrinomonadaceae bacterium]
MPPLDAAPIKTARKKKQKTINAVDLFCGAGGTSTGLVNAVIDLGFEIKLTAINHWDVAIATHSKNHEDVEHFCQSIDAVDPIKIVPGRRLQLLVASPECTHHSRARGGKPRSDQKRADAWLLKRWVEKLYIENILIENVKEFVEWGPLNADDKPDKRHKGKYFKLFIEFLKINYNVEYRVLNCADYGDPTTRERLFIIARRNGKKIVWPERTHASRKELAKMATQPDLFGEKKLEPWVSAREIIDWSLEGKSIFGRKKDLSPNTMRRIFAGLEKYSLKPFIVPQHTSNGPRDVSEPVPTVTTTSRGIGIAEPYLVNLKNKDRRDRSIDEPTFTQNTGNHQGLVEVEPFLIKNFGGADEAEYRSKSIDEPLGTVLANRNHHGVVEAEAFVLGQQSGSVAREVEQPLPTVSGKGAIAVVEPFTVSVAHGGNTNPPRDINEPLGSVLGTPKHAIVEPFVISAGGPELDAKGVDEPMRTVLTRDHQAVVEPFVFNMANTSNKDGSMCKDLDNPLVTINGKGMFGFVEAKPYIVNMKGQSDARSVDDPTFTQTKKQHQYLAEPFIVPFFGEREGQEPRTRNINEPAPTVTTNNRIGLCEAYIVKFYGNEKGAESVDAPLATVTAKDRFGLVQTSFTPNHGEYGLYLPNLNLVIFVRFRMLQPAELAAAMSFPPDYEFTGNRENKVKQIGNAVPLRTAKALCTALLK